MTNIRSQGIWPEHLEDDMKYPSIECLSTLLEMRRKTYVGFAEVEQSKGLLQPEMSLTSSYGQEAVRILTQRGLEELAEAFDSNEEDHYLEELIDAINYFWALAIIDPQAPQEAIVEAIRHRVLDYPHYYQQTHRFGFEQLGQTVYRLNAIFEKLRHRAWMNHAQSQYFDGWQEIANFLGWNLCMILDEFPSWETFVQFYIAKDRVLQFRIQSKY